MIVMTMNALVHLRRCEGRTLYIKEYFVLYIARQS